MGDSAPKVGPEFPWLLRRPGVGQAGADDVEALAPTAARVAFAFPLPFSQVGARRFEHNQTSPVSRCVNNELGALSLSA